MSKQLYYRKDGTPIEYAAAYEILRKNPAKMELIGAPLPEYFIDFVVDSDTQATPMSICYNRLLMHLGRDRKCFTPARIKRMAENASGSYQANVPDELKTEEMTILAVKACKETLTRSTSSLPSMGNTAFIKPSFPR